MRVSEAIEYYLQYHRMNSQKNTMRSYEFILGKLCCYLGNRELESLTSKQILSFLTQFTQGAKQTTERIRYYLLSAFFNLIGNTIE
jgi:site-specific recombinase XerD